MLNANFVYTIVRRKTKAVKRCEKSRERRDQRDQRDLLGLDDLRGLRDPGDTLLCSSGVRIQESLQSNSAVSVKSFLV